MRVLFLLTLLISFRAEARTQKIFSSDGSKATIMLISMSSGDTDAGRMFAALNVTPEDMNGKLTKRAAYDDASGTRVLSIVCVMSKLVGDSGTCTVTLHASSGSAVIDKDSSMGQLHLEDVTEASKAAAIFVLPADNNLIYASADQKLLIQVLRPGNGPVARFSLDIQ